MAAAAEYDFPRLFTAAEAQRTLPLVRTIVRDILALGAQAREVLSGRAAEPSVDELHDQLQDLLAELSGMGCYYKDWNFQFGLVDFPALIDDEVVFLCWRSDEPELRYYHRIEDGYAGAQTPAPALTGPGQRTTATEPGRRRGRAWTDCRHRLIRLRWQRTAGNPITPASPASLRLSQGQPVCGHR